MQDGQGRVGGGVLGGVWRTRLNVSMLIVRKWKRIEFNYCTLYASMVGRKLHVCKPLLVSYIV